MIGTRLRTVVAVAVAAAIPALVSPALADPGDVTIEEHRSAHALAHACAGWADHSQPKDTGGPSGVLVCAFTDDYDGDGVIDHRGVSVGRDSKVAEDESMSKRYATAEEVVIDTTTGAARVDTSIDGCGRVEVSWTFRETTPRDPWRTFIPGRPQPPREESERRPGLSVGLPGESRSERTQTLSDVSVSTICDYPVPADDEVDPDSGVGWESHESSGQRLFVETTELPTP